MTIIVSINYERRNAMNNKKLETQMTKVGKINYHTNPDYKKKTIYFDIYYKDLPKKLRRFRGSTHTQSFQLARESIPAIVEAEHERRISSGVAKKHSSIKGFVANYYDWCGEQVKEGALFSDPTGRKRYKWTENKLIHDKRGIEKYFLPFIERNQVTWTELQLDETIDDLVKSMRLHISDKTIRRYKGSFRTLMKKAKKEGLMYRIPDFPPLDSEGDPMEDGYAIATTQMIDDVFDVIEQEQRASNHLRNVWGYTLLECWVRLLMDTGIRPIPKKPIRYSTLKHNNISNISGTKDNGDISLSPHKITIYRHDKIRNKYWAEGSEETRSVIDKLMRLYKSQDLQTMYLFSNRDGTANVSLNKLFYEVSKKAGWKGLTDEFGKRYTTYSLRKWHINESINNGEDSHEVSIRCGHDYETLVKFYLDKTRKNNPLKAKIWRRNSVKEVASAREYKKLIRK